MSAFKAENEGYICGVCREDIGIGQLIAKGRWPRGRWPLMVEGSEVHGGGVVRYYYLAHKTCRDNQDGWLDQKGRRKC